MSRRLWLAAAVMALNGCASFYVPRSFGVGMPVDPMARGESRLSVSGGAASMSMVEASLSPPVSPNGVKDPAPLNGHCCANLLVIPYFEGHFSHAFARDISLELHASPAGLTTGARLLWTVQEWNLSVRPGVETGFLIGSGTPTALIAGGIQAVGQAPFGTFVAAGGKWQWANLQTTERSLLLSVGQVIRVGQIIVQPELALQLNDQTFEFKALALSGFLGVSFVFTNGGRP